MRDCDGMYQKKYREEAVSGQSRVGRYGWSVLMIREVTVSIIIDGRVPD